ncbi:MAG: DNA methyltransferase [Candidatus Woesearchaeota archaeon]
MEKKPEKLIKRILELATEEGDIVLDYHLGSGTTAAVAHKMNRQYIGVEQIQNQVDLSLTRLNNVIQRDTTGISKAVEWKGGGEFIYFELKKYNEEAKEKILQAQSSEELLTLFNELYHHYFLNYNLDIKEFKEKTTQEKFKQLSLQEQQESCLEMLDKNQMYVNLTEIEDSKYNISQEDIELNKDFYNKK